MGSIDGPNTNRGKAITPISEQQIKANGLKFLQTWKGGITIENELDLVFKGPEGDIRS